MQSVQIPISYVSRTGQVETITFTCGITEPVSNAQARETLDEIKQRAPARYYTQNRMVNGEDYNNFPFTAYNSILKSKALNRASIGTSRYLDLVDGTGKYSSTNSFFSDGALYEEVTTPAFQFTYLTTNDVTDVIINQLTPLLTKAGAQQFYYNFYTRPSLSVLNNTWNQSTTLANETTGYFENSAGNPVSIGSYTSNNMKYVVVGALVKFIPPAGYFFDENNNLKAGVPTRTDEKTVIWASPTAVYLDGTAQGLGNLPNGQGPVVLNNYVPTGAIVSQAIPLFVTDFSTTLRQSILDQILLNQNFGLGYDSTGTVTGTPYTWYVITANNLAVDARWSTTNAGSTSGTNLDASWFIQATTDGQQYTIVSRSLDYYYGSVLQNRFFYFGDQKIYDSRNGTVISDFINVLKTNSKPDNNTPLEGDTRLKIIGQPVQSDGYVDDFQVIVGFEDADSDGVPDDPDFFNTIVAPAINPNLKLVFLQQTVDFDNLQRYLLVDVGVVNSSYATLSDIELVKNENLVGQVFYAYNPTGVTSNIDYSAGLFYTLALNSAGVKVLEPNNQFIARIGRQDLYTQYRHNSPLTSRLDPGSTNIIDLYVVTLAYYTAYQNWIKDSTGTVTEPTLPTIDQLTTEYAGLQDYKMISDNVIVNSVQFLPLFGAKSPEELRATIKVIKSAQSTASISEIKNLVVANMDAYFSIDKWDFGDTFYFSELAAYIHAQIGDVVSSVVLVPLNPEKYFGDLYEIRSAPNQIFVNAATVNNIEVIQALTSTNIRTAPGSGVI
jgi:hypothetical protein